MTREKIEDIRFIVIPFVVNILKGINYEGQGDSDAKEFIDDFNVIFDLAIKALEQEPRWIPVSERLPEKNVWVLVTFKMANGENSVGIKRINQWNGQWEDEIDIAYNENIIAWMPLPKAYSEVKE